MPYGEGGGMCESRTRLPPHTHSLLHPAPVPSTSWADKGDCAGCSSLHVAALSLDLSG